MARRVWWAIVALTVGAILGCGGSSSGGSGGYGAAAGSGGSGAGGGSGGSPSACVQGNACAPEGATCTDSGCCPCAYECSGGKWTMVGCAGCAMPGCPYEAPADGEACGGCSSPVGTPCEYSECGGRGQLTAVCDGSSWQVDAKACEVPACCQSDSECPAPTSVCIDTICKEPVANECWRDQDCTNGMICSGVSVCPCNADCAFADASGYCVADLPECCRTDADCASPTPYCVRGVCKEPAPSGSCWSSRDCPGTTCVDANVCPCDSNCLAPDAPGRCE